MLILVTNRELTLKKRAERVCTFILELFSLNIIDNSFFLVAISITWFISSLPN